MIAGEQRSRTSYFTPIWSLQSQEIVGFGGGDTLRAPYGMVDSLSKRLQRTLFGSACRDYGVCLKWRLKQAETMCSVTASKPFRP